MMINSNHNCNFLLFMRTGGSRTGSFLMLWMNQKAKISDMPEVPQAVMELDLGPRASDPCRL